MIIYKKKNLHFICLLRKTLYLCTHQSNKEKRYMNVTTLNNLAVLHIIRFVVITPGE